MRALSVTSMTLAFLLVAATSCCANAQLLAALRDGAVASLPLPIQPPPAKHQSALPETRRSKNTVAAAASIVLPLFNEGDMWFVTMQVGTPPRDFNFSIDTGSSQLSLVSTYCPIAQCGVPPSAAYNLSATSSAKPLSCVAAADAKIRCDACDDICVSQQDQSFNPAAVADPPRESSLLHSEIVRIGEDLTAVVTVGATFAVSGGAGRVLPTFFTTEASKTSAMVIAGDLGLGFASLASSHAPTFFDALVAQHKGLIADRFALSLSYTGGALTLGGASQPEANFTFVPLVEPFDFYRVRALDVLVNGASLGLPPSTYNGPCIVDSGTPTPTLPTAAFAALSAVLRGYCANATLPALHGVCDVAPNASVVAGGACYEYSEAQIVAFPTIEFVVQGTDGVHVVIPYTPAAYLQPAAHCKSPHHLGFALVEDRHFTVLGASLMTQFEVLFDRADKRVGFAAQMSK